jgi:hypothetical protein
LADRFCEGAITLFQIPLGFRRGAKDFGAVIVELAFPSSDDIGSKTVADQVYAGAEDQKVRGPTSDVRSRQAHPQPESFDASNRFVAR